MTKEMEKQVDFAGKVFELLEGAHKEACKEVGRLLSSGAVDLDKWEGNYRLPKCLAVAILEKMALGYHPPKWDKEALKNIKNLRHF